MRAALCATGFLAVKWISLADSKAEHHDGMIQLVVTFIAAYSTFFLGESELGVSGVLATVAAVSLCEREREGERERERPGGACCTRT